MEALIAAAIVAVLAADVPRNEVNTSDVLTNRYGVDRSGANLHEITLNIDNVNSRLFGKIFEREVDGDMYAQPLIKTGVEIPGIGTRDVIYLATVNNSLYAYDATLPSVSKPYWHIGSESLGEPVPKDKLVDLPSGKQDLNFSKQVGIVSTPVIDAATNTIYVVNQSHERDTYRFQIHALDLATGREKTEMNSPRTIEAEYNGNGVGSDHGKIFFKARKMLNRPGLLLAGGSIYIAFTTHLDGEPSYDAHGWIMAYDAATLKQQSALCTTPDGIQGGVWQSGTGLSAELRGKSFPFIYAVSANGSVGGRNFAQSVLQLYPGALLSVKQAYTPEDQAYLNDRDLDLSTGAVLMPDTPLLVTCSKQGKCYVVNRYTMKLVQEFQAGMNSYGTENAPNIHGAPVLWKNSHNQLLLYVWSEEDFLRSYHFDGQTFQPAGRSRVRSPEKSMPGGILSLSADGAKEGSGIVWASIPRSDDANSKTVDGMVRAFDAANITHELWNSEEQPERDRSGLFAKFSPPVVSGGRVYVGTFSAGPEPNKLVVYGLLTKTN